MHLKYYFLMRYDIWILMSCNASYILLENSILFQERVTIAISNVFLMLFHMQLMFFLENVLEKTVVHIYSVSIFEDTLRIVFLGDFFRVPQGTQKSVSVLKMSSPLSQYESMFFLHIKSWMMVMHLCPKSLKCKMLYGSFCTVIFSVKWFQSWIGHSLKFGNWPWSFSGLLKN